MIRVSRLTDYGLMLLVHIAAHPGRPMHTARDLASETELPLPTVSKLLKALARAGILTSHRGVAGGYGLARAARETTVADIVTALDGPIALTLCTEGAGRCDFEDACPAHSKWQALNDAIRGAFESVTLADMAAPSGPRFVALGGLAAHPIAASPEPRRTRP